MIKHVMQACLAAAVALAIAPNASAAEKVNTTMCVACHSNVGDFHKSGAQGVCRFLCLARVYG